MRLLSLVIGLFLMLATPSAFGQDQQTKPDQLRSLEDLRKRIAKSSLMDQTKPEYQVLGVSDEKTVSLNGKEIKYRLTVDKIGVIDPLDVLPDADIVSFGYAAAPRKAGTKRPVIFAFNGGPGSASVWLHAGAWGPTRLERNGSDTEFGDPPYDFEPNPGFLIDVADIVFVDPVNTGLSKPRTPEDMQVFSSLRRDARANCLFVGNWLRSRATPNRDVYLAGESYGSLRIAAMAAHPICKRQKLNIRGLIFVSGLMDMHARGNKADKYIEDFPTIAAARWFHGFVDKAPYDGNLEKYLEEARRLSIDTVAVAMARKAFAAEEETETELRKACAFINKKTERTQSCFSKYLFDEDDVEIIQHGNFEIRMPNGPCDYDARFPCKHRKEFGYPGGLDRLGDELIAHLRPYITQETGFDIGPDYQWRGPRMSTVNWDMGFLGVNRGTGTNMAEMLARDQLPKIKTANGKRPIKLLSVSGHYDLIAPFFGIERAFKEAGLEVKQINYDAGHMMYFDRDISVKLAQDIRAFIQQD